MVSGAGRQRRRRVFLRDNPENGALKRFNLRSTLSDNHMKPPGNWNSYKIRCVGETLTLWVNGAKQSEFTQCNNPEGYVGLEAEGSRIEFRRLRIKILP
ncbi:MAG: 3-keto-disaccharide hydrolase [Terriglobia bacterium]